MSVTGNFFSKLRSFALTVEKEAAHLEQVFRQEDNDYDEESPMRVLHDLRSEIMSMKSDLQASVHKSEKSGQELNAFMKICRVLQQRNASDIQQIKDTFQKYGYTPLNGEIAENDGPDEVAKSESEGICRSSEPQDIPPASVIEKQAPLDVLRAPQLSDFGLSHYQLPVVWKPQTENVPEEKPKPLYKDIRSVNVARTPKCALRLEEDFSEIQHFGISDYSVNLNDDYTIALINKKKGSDCEKLKDSAKDYKSLLSTPAHLTCRNDFDTVDSPLPPVFCTPGLKVHKNVGLDIMEEEPDANDPEKLKDSAKNYKGLLGTPAHLTYRNDFDSVDSPLPPVFCTPGLKVHKNVGLDIMEEESDANGTDDTSSAKDMGIQCPVDACRPLRSSADALDSPRPPSFCTPGLKVQKKDTSSVHPEPSETEEPLMVKSLDAPPLPSFETKWLKSDTVRTLDITEPIPRPEFSHSVYLTEAASLAVNSDHYYENPTKTSSPPNMREFCIETPSRPEMTSCLTEDLLFKHSLKLTSPPKMSEYENLVWTPTRPEMTSCITEDISQILSRYCKKSNKTIMSECI